MNERERIEKQNMENFLAYAKKLYTNSIAPEPNSLRIPKLNVNKDNECGILFELFSFGYRLRTTEFLQSDSSYKKGIANDPTKMFEYIAEYMKATGYTPILKGIEKDENGNLKNINMTFSENPN